MSAYAKASADESNFLIRRSFSEDGRATQVVSTGFGRSRAINLHCCTKRELGGPHSRAMTPFFAFGHWEKSA
jgi:hypothetical protein